MTQMFVLCLISTEMVAVFVQDVSDYWHTLSVTILSDQRVISG